MTRHNVVRAAPEQLEAAGRPPLAPSGERPRIASLDGLRGLAIALVLLGHTGDTQGFRRVDLGIGDYSRLGVIVFFVISGFLITTLLLAEQDATGGISLRRFYARRSLRIFPAAYAYLAAVAALGALGLVSVTGRDLAHAVTYTVNFQPLHAWVTGHLWSLSVEEQFYLLWPFLVGLSGRRFMARAGLAMVAVGPAARIVNRVVFTGTPYHNLPMFPMVCDSLAMGCLLAIFRGRLEQERWYAELLRPSRALGLLCVVLILCRYRGYTPVSVFGDCVVNACLAILIHRCVLNPGDMAGRALNSRPLVALGVLSYSLYLWQQLFLNRHSNAWICAFPQNLALAFAAAIASYLLLERPLAGLRKKYRDAGS